MLLTDYIDNINFNYDTETKILTIDESGHNIIINNTDNLMTYFKKVEKVYNLLNEDME